MHLPNYLGNTYWLILGAWIIISALLIYTVVDNFYDFIYNDTDLSIIHESAAIMILGFVLTISFVVFILYFLLAKESNTKGYDSKSHILLSFITYIIFVAIFIIAMCMLDAYYTDSNIIEIKQLLISEFETEQCDRKLELLSIYKNTTLNDLNNIETNLQLYKKLFSEYDINELESNYRISCIDSNDLINQIIR